MGTERNSGGNGSAIVVGAIVLAACLAVIYGTPRDSYWIVDCGNKALVAERLLETGFGELSFDYPGAAVDPDWIGFPIRSQFSIPHGEGFVSAYPPAYSALSVPFLLLLGPPGLRVPAALGVAACALLFTVWLTPPVGRRWAVAGGSTLGLATPLFFYGTTVWEHSLTVALSLGAWVVLARPSWVRLASAGLLTASACWFREELALMGLALAAACYLRWRRLWVLAALFAGALLPLAALLAFNSAAYDRPLGPHAAANLNMKTVIAGLLLLGLGLPLVRYARRLPTAVVAGVGVTSLAALGMLAFNWFTYGHPLGALISGTADPLPSARAIWYARQAVGTLSGYGAANVAVDREVMLLGLTAVGAILIGCVSAWRDRGVRTAAWVVLAIGLGTWGFGFARIHMADTPLTGLVRYNGLMIQMPLFCAVGLGIPAVWRREEYASIRIGIAAGMLFLLFSTAFAVATGVTFGVHWGPRLLLPGAPAIVALALVAARREWSGAGRWGTAGSRAAWAALVAAGLLSSAHATWFLFEQKTEGDRLQNAILSLPPRFVVTPHPLLAQQLASLWDRKPMLLAPDTLTFRQITLGLRRHGTAGFIYAAPESPPDLMRAGGVRCRLGARHRGRHLHYLDMDLHVCTFGSRP